MTTEEHDHMQELEGLVKRYRSRIVSLKEHARLIADAAEMLWIVLANVSGGNWKEQSDDWQEAAARWRDNYFAAVTDKRKVVDAVDPVDGSGQDGPRA